MDGSYLEKVWAKSAKRIIALGAEGEEAFLDVIRRKIEEAQDGEKEKLSITFTHTIKLDFGKSKQTDTLGTSLKLKLQVSGEINDPNQDEMFGDEELG